MFRKMTVNIFIDHGFCIRLLQQNRCSLTVQLLMMIDDNPANKIQLLIFMKYFDYIDIIVYLNLLFKILNNLPSSEYQIGL